ncbi:hypothetical protein Pmar_PMAR022407, partial [Perkinsus marinus ATCC 50983]
SGRRCWGEMRSTSVCVCNARVTTISERFLERCLISSCCKTPSAALVQACSMRRATYSTKRSPTTPVMLSFSSSL